MEQDRQIALDSKDDAVIVSSGDLTRCSCLAGLRFSVYSCRVTDNFEGKVLAVLEGAAKVICTSQKGKSLRWS